MADDTRTRIVTATNELFRRHGYNGTSLSQVSKAAPATVGSIYHFFPGGKEALAAEVVQTTGSVYRQLFETITADAPDAPAGFVAFFAGAAAVLEESDFIDPCPIGTVAREVASTNDTLRRAAEVAFDSWVDAARDYLVASGAEDATAHDLALVFVATIEGGFVLSRTKRSPEPLLAASRSLTPLVAAATSRRRSRSSG